MNEKQKLESGQVNPSDKNPRRITASTLKLFTFRLP